MLKTMMIVVVTALLAFGAGVWAKSTVFATGAMASAAASISPYEFHLKVKPVDLPEQTVDNYN